MKLHNKISALLTALVMLCGANANAAATTKFANESLNYEIVYHWGLIWKHAASATLSLSNNGNYYNTSLMARTVSWADKVYKVRDTLTCRIAKDGLRPEQYIKTAHEGKHFSKDVVCRQHFHSQLHRCAKRQGNKARHPAGSRSGLRYAQRVLLSALARFRQHEG